MFRLFPSAVRPKHGLVPVAVAVLLTATLIPSRPQPAFAAGACEPLRPHAAGTFPAQTITTSDGLTREYILHIPASYSGEEAVPLLFNFHGLTSNALDQDLYSQLPAEAAEEGFVLVTPQGTLNADGFTHWNSNQLPDPEPDDVAFISELLSVLESQLCIDSARVFSTGISNGGGMSSQLACSLPDRIAAIAPVAGASFFESCSPRPVPVIAFHGTADLLISLGPIESTVIPAWAAHNGCTSFIEQNPVPGTVGVRLLRYEDCDQGATVELYVIFDADPATPGEQGGGHAWPGSTVVVPPPLGPLLGLASPEISANDLMWDFFLAHPHPLRPKIVGGIFTDLDGEQAGLSLETTTSSGNTGGPLAGLIAATTAAAFALGGAAWYARRRWAGR